jgi:hypothetical protein
MLHEQAHSPFPVTHWTLIHRAGQSDTEARSEALAEVLKLYMAPLRFHLVRRFRVQAAEADDLLQSFIASRVLEKQLVAGADEGKGRFRSYLLTALDRFVCGERRHDRAARRRPQKGLAGIDAVAEPASGDVGPDAGFDLEWARATLAKALDHMRGECGRTGRADLWRVFEARLLAPLLDGDEPADQGELARSLSVTEEQVSNLLVTAKRSFKRALRAVIGQYELNPDRIDEEIDDLHRIFTTARRPGVSAANQKVEITE